MCSVLGKPVAITFQYIPGTMVDTAQDAGKADILFQGGVDDDGISFVVVTDQSGASNALSGSGRQFFRGNVAVDEFFEANEAIDSFASATYIHFFDDANGGLRQSITYHTSCSQPIQLGDVIGNATLTGYAGETGSAALPLEPVDPPVIDPGDDIILETDQPFDPGNIGEDADSPTGPIAQLGDKVTFTYQIANIGNVASTITDLVDDNGTPGDPDDDFMPVPVLKANGKNFGDDNNDDLLDLDEVWYFQAMRLATEPGQQKNTAKVTTSFMTMFESEDEDMSHHIVNPLQFEKYVYIAPEPQGGDVCDSLGNPVALTFQYIPGTTVNTGQDSGKAEILFQGNLDDDGVSFVVVTDQSSASNALSGSGKQFFRGDVAFDELFEANEETDSFGSTSYIHFFDDVSGGLLQSIEYHTSCSQPIQLGDLIGNATLLGYDGDNGSDSLPIGSLGDPADSPTGPFVLLGDEVVCHYQVTNVGNVDLVNVLVTDDVLGTITDIVHQGDGDQILAPGETWVLKASTVAKSLGQQLNVGTVTANSTDDPTGEYLSLSDPAYHFVEGIKFFVVDKSDNMTYTYTASGTGVSQSGLQSGNSDSRGAASNLAGDKLWVVDKDRFIYVYQVDGTRVGAWKAKDIGNEAEGIAVAPTDVASDPTFGDIWIVDRDKKKVFFFDAAAGRKSGEFNSNSSFNLVSANDHPKGITTDGASLWVVDDDGGTEQVFKYTIGGKPLGSWEIADAVLEEPRGITLDLYGGTTLWVVDKKSDMVYQFDNAIGLSSGSKASDGAFALTAANSDAEGIADPRPFMAVPSESERDIQPRTHHVDGPSARDDSAILVASNHGEATPAASFQRSVLARRAVRAAAFEHTSLHAARRAAFAHFQERAAVEDGLDEILDTWDKSAAGRERRESRDAVFYELGVANPIAPWD